jgi:hypothetical protein
LRHIEGKELKSILDLDRKSLKTPTQKIKSSSLFFHTQQKLLNEN